MKKFVCGLTLFFLIIFSCMPGCGAGETQQAFYELESQDILPAYYHSYMSAKVKQIKYNEDNNDVDLSFAFLTDLHWDFNAGKSPKLLKCIRDNTNIKKVVFGGDYISLDHESPEKSLQIMGDCFNSFGLDEYYAVLGNHDTNINNGGDTPFIPYGKSMEVISGGRIRDAYYRVDFSDFCLLFLNTNDFEKDNDQYQWLGKQLTSLGADKTVFIFMHEYYRSYGKPLKVERNSKGTLVDELIYSIREQMKCTVAAIFTGHIHHDYYSYNKYGCPVIATSCDGFEIRPENDEYYRERGMITEQVFDVVQVDKLSRKIFLTRIGAGNDRTIEY